ncbi:hypothetical protein SAMN05880582_10773 [Rhizobium sp. RU20A]|nr:hypothetical protein SAMN05880582_10773 [Rhizobium sp. RU20A]
MGTKAVLLLSSPLGEKVARKGRMRGMTSDVKD